jgi:DNA-binding HxlR family transcriptional regulator
LESQGEPAEFNEARAELFEVLGHQTRIKILQALSQKSMGFAELKRETQIESGGLLSFHLRKLAHLVKLTPDGDYTLSDEGKEALRVIATISSEERNGRIRPKVLNSGNRLKVLAAIFIVALIALGGLGLYQQQQIGVLSKEVSANLVGTVSIGGNSFWYMTMPAQMASGATNGTTISFHGVTFTLLRPGSYASGTSAIIMYVVNGNSTAANGSFTIANGTSTTVPVEVFVTNGTAFCTSCNTSNKTGVPVTVTLEPQALTVYLLPRVQVGLPNGESQILLSPQSSSNTLAYVQGSNSFWFTGNMHPIVGVSVNYQAGTVTFYVQATG